VQLGAVRQVYAGGIPIEALIEYAALFQQGESTREARKAILWEQREQLALQIAEMRETLNKLDHKIARYDATIGAAEKTLTKEKTHDLPDL
jgi:DNA-binding transcriptional MerR regulator